MKKNIVKDNKAAEKRWNALRKHVLKEVEEINQLSDFGLDNPQWMKDMRTLEAIIVLTKES
jgi:hypothetical protein